MDNQMTTWWFAGELLGAYRLANDESAPASLRETMRQLLADRLEHWEIGDDKHDILCRRIYEKNNSKTAC